MAYINDPGGGRSGPYWRRQMHTTLPGERTGAQLQMINLARQRMGLPPLGGPGPGRQANPAGGPSGPPGGRDGGFLPQPLPGMHGGYHPMEPGGDVMVPDDGVGPMAGEPGAPPPGVAGSGEATAGVGQTNQPTDLEELRSQLLNRYHGATQPSYSRDALRAYAQKHMQQRNAVGANQPRRPILPQRRAQKAIPY